MAKALIEGTDKGYKTILHPSQIAQTLIRQVGPFLMRRTGLQSKIQYVLEELNVAYRSTHLSEDHGGARGPGPGERAPDATTVRASDFSTVRIFELLRGHHWLLLAFTGFHPREEDVQGLEAVVSASTARLGDRIRSYMVVSDESTIHLPESTLVDRTVLIHEAYGVDHPTLVLIRPDDYIAFRGKGSDGEKLKSYLDRVFTK